MENVNDIINRAIIDTSARLGNDSIKSAKDMIPLMGEDFYKGKYNLDISYGEKEDEKFDIFYPDGENAPFPVFIEIHGGAWYFGQKRSIEFSPFLLGKEKGFACISIGYSLCPEVAYPEPVLQIKKAIIYIKRNHKKLNIDPDKIIVWGGSAGAQLAALAVLSEDTGYLKIEDEIDSKVKGLVLWYGCFNYFDKRNLEDWVYLNYFGVKDLKNVIEKLILSDPGCHVTGNAPKTFLQHGKADGLVPYEQSIILGEALKQKIGNNCIIDIIEGCDHADQKMFKKENIEKVFEFALKCIYN